jgi:hypothetical protein
MIIKEWFCGEHGAFEGSHAICPVIGCESAEVVREIRTAPGFKSDITKRTDAGLRKTAEGLGLSNLRSAKVGESAKPRAAGTELLWGDAGAKMLGKSLTEAHQPAAFDIKTPEGQQAKWVDRGGMVELANAGITQRVLPVAAERTVSANDQKLRAQVVENAKS